MSEAKNNPLHPRPADQAKRAEALPPDPDEDVLAAPAPVTDEAPTIITKNKPAATPPPPPDSDIRGRRLAHFELLEQIGAGGMAAVLRARDTQLDRFVALKILPPDLAQDQENIKRFHQEARAAARLDHENIARVFFCGEDQKLHFIAFEFVEGDNLRAILERRGRLPVSEALTYMIQIAAGLRHASERGVVHRDIKPSNIIITPNGRAKLVDMGLARSLEPQNDQGLTHSGVTLGTFDYISPEQALEPRDADVRSDIYSLGCTFYHMLTGRPPVPEGTAARKLHHHQYVKPIDPRELVAGLPDEIVRVLARMMAKNPSDRYQSAQELLHHLLATARKLGTTAEVPEGLLMVETDVPTPAGSAQPFLLGGLAVAAVIILIFCLDQGGPPPVPNPTLGQPADPEASKPRPVTAAVAQAPGGKELEGAKALLVRNPAAFSGDLATLIPWLRENHDADQLDIELTGGELDILLSGEQMAEGTGDRPLEPGLVLKANKRITLKARPGAPRPTIRLRYAGATPNPGGKPWSALTIDCPESRIEGLRVEINASESKYAFTGIHFRGGKHELRDCEILQALPSSERLERQMAGVVIEANGSAGSLKLVDSLFVGYATQESNPAQGRTPHWQVGKASPGQNAVIRRGPVDLDVRNCAFGPHGSLLVLEKGEPTAGGANKEPLVQLSHCTILATGPSAVFELEEQASAALVVNHCLISRPGETEEGECVLVRQKGIAGKVHYTGNENRYHNLSEFWVLAAGGAEIGLKDFATQLPLKERGQDNSRVLTGNPWKKTDPMGKLEVQEFVDAFVINDPERDLRLPSDSVVGIEHHFLGKKLPEPPPLPPLNQLIVDPSGKNDSLNRIYQSLKAAIADSKPGDVILIRHNGELQVRPQRLEETAIALTIKPDVGFRPILVLGEAREADTALFWLHDGKLVLEGLELRLQPQRADFEAQTLVAFLGEGQCTFKNCIITLDQQGHGTALSLAALHDLDGLMMRKPASGDNPPASQTPQLVLDNCLVRGDGDLLVSKSSRSFEVDLSNVAVALKGTLLCLKQPLARTATGGQGQLSVHLKEVTTYLAGYLLHWKMDKEIRNVTPPSCTASNCAFFPVSTRNALVRLDLPEMEIDPLREKLRLIGPNACGYFSLFDNQPGGEMTMEQLTLERWVKFTETNTSRRGIKLATPPAAEASFSRLLPGQLKPLEAEGFGADLAGLQKLLTGENEGK